MTVAVIFVPAEHVATYATMCLDYCTARGYEVAGLVTTNWDAAAAMLIARTADILVVARHDHLDPAREPRIEVVAETPPDGARPDHDADDRHRRPRQV